MVDTTLGIIMIPAAANYLTLYKTNRFIGSLVFLLIGIAALTVQTLNSTGQAASIILIMTGLITLTDTITRAKEKK